MRKSAVVSWYLEQLVAQGQIESEDELLERKTLLEKVIDRLMYHVSLYSFQVNYIKCLKQFSLTKLYRYVKCLLNY